LTISNDPQTPLPALPYQSQPTPSGSGGFEAARQWRTLCLWFAFWATFVAVTCLLQSLPLLWDGRSSTQVIFDTSIQLNFTEIAIAVILAVTAYRSATGSQRWILALIGVSLMYCALCGLRALLEGPMADWVWRIPDWPTKVTMVLSNVCFQIGWSIFPAAMVHLAYRRRKLILGMNNTEADSA
jgi:hypothetical protein